MRCKHIEEAKGSVKWVCHVRKVAFPTDERMEKNCNDRCPAYEEEEA